MPYRLPPARGYDLSDYQLGRSHLYGPLRDFLKHYAHRDRVHEFFDFVNWTDAGTSFTFAQTQTSVPFTAVDALNGVMAGTSVATTTASISMVGKTRFNGNNNCLVEARFKINTVANTFLIEAGWVDAAPATGASFVTDIDVPSFAGTNGVVFGIWNNQTHTSFAFASVGSFTSQTVASYLVTAANSSFTTPVADTYLTVQILLLTDPDETAKSKAYGWLNGNLVAKLDNPLKTAGYVNGQGALYPWLYLQSVSANAKILTCDYIRVSQDRAALMGALE